MSSLVELYKNYYREQTPESIAYLFDGMLEYDYVDYWSDIKRVAAMHSETKLMGDCSTLWTNGSTGTSKKYEFGPYLSEWACRIEQFLRNMQDGATIFLCARLGNGVPPRRMMFDEVHSSNKKHFETNANFLDDAQIEELFSHVAEIHGKGWKINFSAFPDVWNMLLSNPRFNELCRENRDKIGCFVNNDFEMFITTKEFYVRDQMINWVSGVNFFVCKHGTTHHLPTFGPGKNCLNLINLRKKFDGSDEVSVEGERPSVCLCGVPYMPIRIEFHKHNRILDHSGIPIKLSHLGASLEGRYATLQIHQDKNEKVTVFANTIGRDRKSVV